MYYSKFPTSHVWVLLVSSFTKNSGIKLNRYQNLNLSNFYLIIFFYSTQHPPAPKKKTFYFSNYFDVQECWSLDPQPQRLQVRNSILKSQIVEWKVTHILFCQKPPESLFVFQVNQLTFVLSSALRVASQAKH